MTYSQQLEKVLGIVVSLLDGRITVKDFRLKIAESGINVHHLHGLLSDDPVKETQKEISKAAPAPAVPAVVVPPKVLELLVKKHFHADACLDERIAYEQANGIVNNDIGSQPFQAQLRGRCDQCGKGIQVGDWIVVRSQKVQRAAG